MKRSFFHTITAGPKTEERLPRFAGRTLPQFETWQRKTRSAFLGSLGRRPRRVRLRLETVERHVSADHIREKLVYNLEPGLAATAWFCRPRTRLQQKLPAVLCFHGAGPGKDPLVGLWNGAECLEYHKLVSRRLAQQGFVTLTPDRRGHGECAAIPYGSETSHYLAVLDEFYQRTRRTTRSNLDVWDALQALDVLCARTEVDASRIGCLGVFDGGFVATAASALDHRVKSVSVTCFGDESLFALLCPRPLQLQAPEADQAVPLQMSARLARRVFSFYELAGHPARFEHHVFDGVTELDFPAAAVWFQRTLQ